MGSFVISRHTVLPGARSFAVFDPSRGTASQVVRHGVVEGVCLVVRVAPVRCLVRVVRLVYRWAIVDVLEGNIDGGVRGGYVLYALVEIRMYLAIT